MLLVFIIIVIIIIVNNNNAMRRKEKYLNLIKEMSRNYRCVKFVNLSMSSLGVFSNECSMFLDMMNDIGIDKKQQPYIIKKMIAIAIRATYYISCFRTRNWDSPDLMQFDVFSFPFFSFFLFLFLFLFLFFFGIIQSQTAFVNCLYVARFTIVHSKTQIKFPLLLLLLFYYFFLSMLTQKWHLVGTDSHFFPPVNH